jgi:hypothetical protein
VIADLRDTLMPAVREQGGEAAPWADAMHQVAALQRMVDDAPRSTFTRKIRLDADQLRDVAARLRIAATRAPENGELSAVLARLDEIVREAPPTGEAKISAIVLYVIVVDLRDAVLAAV